VQPPHRREAAATEARVRELHGQGLRGVQIDRAMGWKPDTAKWWQRKLGLDSQRPIPPAGDLGRQYAEAGSVEGLARQLGVRQRRVRAALAEAGIEIGRRPEHPLTPHLEDLRRAYVDERVPLPVLAARYGYTPLALRSFLNKHGIRTRRRITRTQQDQIDALRVASGIRCKSAGVVPASW
jgi:hypothetical protein